jgi:hypothetical protein
MTTPVTAQQRQNIITSANIFEDGVNMMNQIYNDVFAAGDQLKGQAMVSTAGSLFAQVITRWTDDFNNIKNLLQAMHDQLMSTVDQTFNTNQANEEIAQSIAYTAPAVH